MKIDKLLNHDKVNRNDARIRTLDQRLDSIAAEIGDAEGPRRRSLLDLSVRYINETHALSLENRRLIRRDRRILKILNPFLKK